VPNQGGAWTTSQLGCGFSLGRRAATRNEQVASIRTSAGVVGEFQKFLRCGVLAWLCLRCCGDDAFERLLPFSCKGR
jgi:hypothetical protein